MTLVINMSDRYSWRDDYGVVHRLTVGRGGGEQRHCYALRTVLVTEDVPATCLRCVADEVQGC